MTDAVPGEFIPDEHIVLTDYTAENLDTLAKGIAAETGEDPAKILKQLEKLVHQYAVPVANAERAIRAMIDEEGGL